MAAFSMAQSTVNRELDVIRGCFPRAVEWKRLTESPLNRAIKSEEPEIRQRIVELEDWVGVPNAS